MDDKITKGEEYAVMPNLCNEKKYIKVGTIEKNKYIEKFFLIL